MRLLLGAHRPGLAPAGIEEPRLLHDRAAFLDECHLAARLVIYRLHDEADRVHILDFAARAERRAGLAHRDVAVEAQRALLHVAVAGAAVAQDRAQLADIGARLLRATDVRLGDDLHQRDAGTVEIDIGLPRVLVVHALPGVLFQMQARDADLARRAVRHVEDDLSLSDDRLQISVSYTHLRAHETGRNLVCR